MDGMVHAFSSLAIHQAKSLRLKRDGGESIVVKIKAARQSPATIEHERAHHCAGSVVVLLKRLRDRAKTRIERLAGKILHSILKGISASQNDGMGRPRERDLRVGMFE